MYRANLVLIPIVVATLLVLDAPGAPAAEKAAAETRGEVGVAGRVLHTGLYPLKDRKTTVLDAIDAATTEDDTRDYEVTVTRKLSAKLTETIHFNSLRELRQSPDAAPVLHAGDRISVQYPKEKPKEDGL